MPKRNRIAVRTPRDFQFAWLCALHHEYAASLAMLDEEYDLERQESAGNDNNVYVVGRIGRHDLVMVCLPAGMYGIDSATSTVRDMLRSFQNIKYGLLVGIGGGVPGLDPDIRLGDVVIGLPGQAHAGVVQYEVQKSLPGGSFERRRHLNKPPRMLLNAAQSLRTDQERYGALSVSRHIEQALQNPHMAQNYKPPYAEPDVLVSEGQRWDRKPRPSPVGSINATPVLHSGLIATGSKVIASATERERLRESDPGILCFEMEAGGVVDELPCLVVRGISDYADADKRDNWQRYAALCAAAYARELVLLLQTSNSQGEIPSLNRQIGPAQDDRHSPDEDPFARKMWFPEQDLRELQITAAHDDTCDWIFEVDRPKDKRPSFVEWLKGPNGIFWIQGKPGSGKSTLMKQLANSKTLVNHLDEWVPGQRLVLVRHFFFRPGTDIQSSFVGFLRHILFQVISVDPTLVSASNQLPVMMSKAWLLEQIDCALRAASALRLFFLIDGMDELTGSEEDQDDFLQLVNRLASLQNTKICVSSRPEYVFRQAFESSASVRMQDNTFEAFRKVAIGTLQGPSQRFDSYYQRSGEEATKFVDEISRKADGVFLWLHLALNELVRGVKRKDSLHLLRQRLKSMESSLDGLFKDMLNRLDEVYQSRAADLLCCCSYYPRLSSPIIAPRINIKDDDNTATLPVGLVSGEDSINVLELAVMVDLKDEIHRWDYGSLPDLEVQSIFDRLQNFADLINEHSSGLLEVVDLTECGAKELSDCCCDWHGNRPRHACKSSRTAIGLRRRMFHDAIHKIYGDDHAAYGEMVEKDAPTSTAARMLWHFGSLQVQFIHRSAHEFIMTNDSVKFLLQNYGALRSKDLGHEVWARFHYDMCKIRLFECLETMSAAQTSRSDLVIHSNQNVVVRHLIEAWDSFQRHFFNYWRDSGITQEKADRLPPNYPRIAKLLRMLKPRLQRGKAVFAEFHAAYPFSEEDASFGRWSVRGVLLPRDMMLSFFRTQAESLCELSDAFGTASFRPKLASWIAFSILRQDFPDESQSLRRLLREMIREGLSPVGCFSSPTDSTSEGELKIISRVLWFRLLPEIAMEDPQAGPEENKQVLNECCNIITSLSSQLIDADLVFSERHMRQLQQKVPGELYDHVAQLRCSVFFAVKHVWTAMGLNDCLIDAFKQKTSNESAFVVRQPDPRERRPADGSTYSISLDEDADNDTLSTFVCDQMEYDLHVDHLGNCWAEYERGESKELLQLVERLSPQKSSEVTFEVKDFCDKLRIGKERQLGSRA